ncbi:MAG: hypothetical protein ACWA41_11125 [Putridiphycobacter sp.]
MTKYKINRDQKNPKVPTKAEMEKYKDFSRLTANYDKFAKRPKKPLYKDKKFFIGLLIVVLIAYLLSLIK